MFKQFGVKQHIQYVDSNFFDAKCFPKGPKEPLQTTRYDYFHFMTRTCVRGNEQQEQILFLLWNAILTAFPTIQQICKVQICKVLVPN